MATDLTAYAVAAYDTRVKTGFTANPHIGTSPAWYAHELGIHFENTGRSRPQGVRMSRGYSIRANDMVFKIHDSFGGIEFERIK